MAETCNVEATDSGKKPRKRMRAIYAKVAEQMEFYFSDSNLHKDRFLKKTVQENKDGYVDLSTFLKFNKMKTITDSVKVIADALSYKSSFLQVNEDKTKVRRLTPLSEPKDIDKRTVYVECLPHSIDHDWMKRVFAPCGKVTYISLPKYPSSGDLKGFGFVEFETEEAAKKACEDLNNPPAGASNKPGMFPKTSKTLEALKKKLPPDQIMDDSGGAEKDENAVQNKETDMIKPGSLRRSRRKRALSESSLEGGNCTSESPVKRKKSEVSFELPEGSKSEDNEKTTPGSGKKRSKKRKQRSKTSDSVSSTDDNSVLHSKTNDTSADEVTSESPSAKKRRIDSHKSEEKGDVKQGHKQSPKKKADNQNKEESVVKKESAGEEQSKETGTGKKKRRKRKKQHKPEFPELRVIPKEQWVELRNEYLKLQKDSMAKLKKKLQKTHQDENKKKGPDQRKGKEIEFIPDVIVKVVSENPLTRQKLKGEIPASVNVAYMDIKDGLYEGHVRCQTADSAHELLKQNLEGYKFSKVEGEDECMYWNKLKSDRESKYNIKTKNKTRGQKKLTDKAQKTSMENFNITKKHIVFEDED